MQEIPYQKMQSINPNDIASIEIFKSDSALQRIGREDYGGVINITTKKSAIEQYRNNYSKHSDEYKSFIQSIPIEDELKVISYCVNGEIIDNNPEIVILNVSKQKILEISVSSEYKTMQDYNLEDKRGIVIIRTE